MIALKANLPNMSSERLPMGKKIAHQMKLKNDMRFQSDC